MRAKLKDTRIKTSPGPLGIQLPHITGANFETPVPGMDINYGWKIHGDFVKDLTKSEAYGKLGLDENLKIIDQNLFDTAHSRFKNLGVSFENADGSLSRNSIDSLFFHSRVEVGQTSGGLARFESRFSNPLDTISMMEVFEENQTQYKASQVYGKGREFTGYTQTLEERDKLITALESRLGNRLEDVDPTILGGRQTEGATQLSKKITGRFTTEYAGVPAPGEAMDWSTIAQDPFKGQAALDRVALENPDALPYIHTGVIDENSYDNLQKLVNDYPEFKEVLHGPSGYVSPYGTIEESFSQQGIPYSSQPPKATAPVQPPKATAPIQQTVNTPPSGQINVGAKVNGASTSVPSRTNAPVAPRVVDDTPVLGKGNVITSGTQSGSAQVTTPPPSAPVSGPTAKVSSTPHPGSSAGTKLVDDIAEGTTSSGAPLGKTASKLKNLADDASKRVAKGGNLKLVGLGALLGAGALAINSRRTVQDNIDRRLEMQRGGEFRGY